MSIQLENGYTKIANEWLDIFCCTSLSDREWRVLHTILRKTYGYNKKKDAISFQQFEKITNIKARHITTIIKKLEQKKMILVDRTGYVTKYSLNKVSPKWGIPQMGDESIPQMGDESIPQMGEYKRKKDNKRNTTTHVVSNIIIKQEEFTMEELEYVSLDEKQKNKNPYGKRVMAVLVRKFAECAGVEIKGTFDGSRWSKPLSEIYNYFDKDPVQAMRFMERSIGYFEEKHLTYTPETLAKNLPLIDKWIESAEEKQFNPDLYE